MEFDKSRIYTAVNAEELKIGSECIFADTVYGLREKLQNKDLKSYIRKLTGILLDDNTDRFESEKDIYALAYLVESPSDKKEKYKPFSSVEKAIETIRKHGCFLQSEKIYSFIATHLTNCDCVFLGGYWLTVKDLYEDFFFADDGSPCGELVEE